MHLYIFSYYTKVKILRIGVLHYPHLIKLSSSKFERSYFMSTTKVFLKNTCFHCAFWYPKKILWYQKNKYILIQFFSRSVQTKSDQSEHDQNFFSISTGIEKIWQIQNDQKSYFGQSNFKFKKYIPKNCTSFTILCKTYRLIVQHAPM